MIPVIGIRPKQSFDQLPESLPAIELHRGEALWVLAQLGFQGSTTESTFNEYIKSLRKLGTPFEHQKKRAGPRRRASYSFSHLMELALALTLRVYHVVPDAVLVEIVQHRRSLYRAYRRAYSDRRSGLGAPIMVEVDGEAAIQMQGAFLDLQINFSGGKLVSFGPPKLLSPYQALSIFVSREIASRAFLPINLSRLSERLVSTALRAPVIRTGPRRQGGSRRFAPKVAKL